MKHKLQFVVSLLFGLMFINAGLNKFFNYMPVPEGLPEKLTKAMSGMMDMVWLMPLLGSMEIVGGVLFIIPKTRALGAIVVFPIMIGILLSNIFLAPSGLPIALALMGINIWVIADNWKKYLPMLG
jgi:putative oxidoreductase